MAENDYKKNQLDPLSRNLLLFVALVISGTVALAVLRPWKPGVHTDLPQFYAAAKLAHSGQIARLYDRSAYVDLVPSARSPKIGYNVYYNRPAWSAVPLAALGGLSYDYFERVWMGLNYALLFALVGLLPRWFNGTAGVRVWMLSFHPFVQSIYMGQDTLLLTLLIGFGIHQILRGNDRLGGAALALCVFKPHLVVVLPLVLAFYKRWRAVTVFCAISAALAAASFALVGPHGFAQWMNLLNAPTTDADPAVMGNLRNIAYQFGLPVAISAGIVCTAAFAVCIIKGNLQTSLAGALFVAPMFSPHSYLSDYAITSIAALLAPVPGLRYFVLLPWTYFYPHPEPPVSAIPFVIMGLVFVSAMACRLRNGAHHKGRQCSASAPWTAA